MSVMVNGENTQLQGTNSAGSRSNSRSEWITVFLIPNQAKLNLGAYSEICAECQ